MRGVDIAMIDIATLPCIRYRERIPERRGGIYFLLSVVNVPLYIGESRNLQKRWNGSHHIARFVRHDPTINTDELTVAWYVVRSWRVRRVTEKRLIAHFRPVLNRNYYKYVPSVHEDCPLCLKFQN